MAETTVTKVIDVKVENLESLNTLVKQVDELSKALESLDKNSGEYKDVLSQLIKSQSKISSALKGQKTETQALEGSYNALSKKLSGLRKEWKATNDEAKRNELGGQIMEVNNELKELDKSVGSYQRNVGNYTNSIKEAFVTPRQHLKNLKEELAQLEEGTEEYNSVLRETAQVSGDLQRLNEQLRYSSADLGDVIGNVAGVAQGVIGGLGAIQGVMALFGEDDHYAETIQNLTAIMAIVQGLGALEGLRDKIKGLSDAWKGFKKSAEGTTGVIGSVSDSLTSIGGSAENASGGMNKVSNTLKGATNTLNEGTKALDEGTKALNEQAQALSVFGYNIDEANAKLDEFGEKVHKRGKWSKELVEDELRLKTIFGEEVVELEKEVKFLELRIENAKGGLEYDKQMIELRKKQKGDFEIFELEAKAREREIAADTKELALKKERIAQIKNETASVQQNTQAITQNTKATEKNNNSLKEMTTLEKVATVASNGLGKALNAIGIGGKVASLAMKGLKAAITATGIGALIVLSGELINLLFKGVDALKGWISGANKAKRQADELKSAMDALNESFEATNDAMDFEVRKMEAMGKDYEDIYNYKKKYLQQQIQEVKQLMASSEAYQRFLTLTDKQKKKSKFEGIVEAATDLQERLKDLEKQLNRLNEDKVVHDLADKAKKDAEDLEKAGTKAGTSIKKSTDDAAESLKKYRDELKKTIDEYNNLITGLDRERESPIERIKREYQERMDLADRAEKAETDLLKSQLDEREISREEYERKSLEIAQKYSEGRLKIQRRETEEGKRELAKQANDRAQAELQAMRRQYEAYQKQMQNQDKLGAAEADIEKYSNPDRRNVWKYLLLGDPDKKSYKQDMEDIQKYYSATLDNLNARHDSFMSHLKEQGSVWEGIMNDETLDMDTRAKAQQSYLDIKMQMQDAETENMIRNKEIQAEQLKAEDARWQLHLANIKQYTQEMVSSTTSLFSSMADIYEQDYENKKDGDEKSQRIAKKSFKKSQALRIAEATINTLNGAIGGYTQAVQAYGVPWGVVLGAATAASVTAAGMAQIQKIRSTQFDSSGSSLGSGGTTFQLPQIEQYEPTYTQNVTQESDTDRLMNAVSEGMSKTQLYVSVTDINNVQNKVRVTENEASW